MAKATSKTKNDSAPKGVDIKVPDLVAMLEAGVHFGHERSKRNPRMEPYIFLQRNRIAIIDLEKTQAALKKAAIFLAETARTSTRDILIVGTKRQARDLVRRHAEAAGMPYVTKRWLGGTLTNFATIQKSVEKLDDLKSLQDTAAVEKMTKKERAVMQKEIQRLESVLEGMMTVRTMPAAIIVVGVHDEKLTVREARRVGVPVVGVTDTNADPTLVDYPIPANDDAVRALDLVIGTLAEAVRSGRAQQAKVPA